MIQPPFLLFNICWFDGTIVELRPNYGEPFSYPTTNFVTMMFPTGRLGLPSPDLRVPIEERVQWHELP